MAAKLQWSWHAPVRHDYGAAAAHAEGSPGRRRGRAGRPAPAMRKQQAEAGDIILLYGDESEALTHPTWPRLGEDRRGSACAARGRRRRSRCWARSITRSANSSSHQPTKRSSDSSPSRATRPALWPKPGSLHTGGAGRGQRPIHTSKLAMAALATRVIGSP